MSEVGDAVELTYTTAPGATVTVSWINRDTDEMTMEAVPVPESLTDAGRYPVTVVGTSPGFWEARFASTGTATAVESYFERFDPAIPTPPLATVGEYVAIYGALSAAKEATARALLRRASTLVRDSFPGIEDRIASGRISRDSVGLAVLNMTARVLRNPSGLRSESVGPISRAYDTEQATGMLTITESDTALLTAPDSASSRRGRYRTVRITGGMVPSRQGRRWPRGPHPF